MIKLFCSRWKKVENFKKRIQLAIYEGISNIFVYSEPYRSYLIVRNPYGRIFNILSYEIRQCGTSCKVVINGFNESLVTTKFGICD